MTYKINNIELTEEQVKEVAEHYNKKSAKPGHKRKYFEPKRGIQYFYASIGGVSDITNVIPNIVKRGVFRTEEEAKHADERRMALVRIWNWADDNAPFTPDWENDEQDKCFACVNANKWSSYITWTTRYQFELPHFATPEDCERFIKECHNDLEIIRK